jgi:hypothetical protein
VVTVAQCSGMATTSARFGVGLAIGVFRIQLGCVVVKAVICRFVHVMDSSLSV